MKKNVLSNGSSQHVLLSLTTWCSRLFTGRTRRRNKLRFHLRRVWCFDNMTPYFGVYVSRSPLLSTSTASWVTECTVLAVICPWPRRASTWLRGPCAHFPLRRRICLWHWHFISTGWAALRPRKPVFLPAIGVGSSTLWILVKAYHRRTPFVNFNENSHARNTVEDLANSTRAPPCPTAKRVVSQLCIIYAGITKNTHRTAR